MGKVKSAIITALIVAAVVILSLFAVISCPLGEVQRYNSFLTSIHMGSSLTGEAYALFYPEGVISEAEYNSVVNDPDNQNREEYMSGYTDHHGIYVENEKYGPEFAKSVAQDAEIISDRFGQRGFAGYSVSVVDDYVIRVAVPTNFTYAAMTERDASSRESALTEVSYSFRYLALNGELDLRNGSDENAVTVLSVNTDFADLFSGISYSGVGGNNVVRMDLTNEGYDTLKSIVDNAEDTLYIFVGDTCMQLSISKDDGLQGKTLGFSISANYAKDYAIVMNSVANGNVLANEYNDNGDDTQVVALTPAFGNSAVVVLWVAMLLVLLGAMAYPIIRYKKLGMVNALTALTYSAVMVTALLVTGIQLTVAGAFMIVLGLALLSFTNIHVFEAVRRETLTGRTIQASVKTGYKKTLTAIIDLHVILLVVSAAVALICNGELMACGLIMFIATIASYILYWFTRFMWFVVSSPVKDKFKFCGYKREYDDED